MISSPQYVYQVLICFFFSRTACEIVIFFYDYVFNVTKSGISHIFLLVQLVKSLVKNKFSPMLWCDVLTVNKVLVMLS